MMKNKVLVFLLLSTINFLCFSQEEAEINSKLLQLYNKNGFSGIIHVQKGIDTVYSEAFGFRNFEEKTVIDKDTKFNLGSITKVFTAVAAIKLLDKHNINIDSTIENELPTELKGLGLGNITYKQLMTHTAGLGSYLSNSVYSNNRENYRNTQDFYKKELFEFSGKPGESFQYSNTGILLLGLLLEQLESAGYYSIIQKHIFDVAQMSNSGFYETDEIVENRAIGYYKEDNKILSNFFQHSVKGTPAGGSYSTINDMLSFYKCFNNGTLIPDTLKQKLLTPQIKNPRSRRESSFVGLIFSVDTVDKNFGHSGGSTGISCYSRYFPKKDITVLIFQNFESSRTTRRIVENILEPWE